MLSTARLKRDVESLSESDRLRRQTMTGWAVVNMRMRVVDSKMRDVPRDMQTVGEIVTFGDHVMDGYFGDPDTTASVISDGWLRTGDMAVWDEEGYVSIVDRKKETIISGGENISSIQVEGVIASHPEVLECAVVAAPDEKWGEVPVAIVVRKPGATLDSEELVGYLQSRLGKFKLPRIIEFWDEPLPRTGTGKIRKLVLRERFWQGKERRVQG
jgi:fatty-acyl-CoA synthase